MKTNTLILACVASAATGIMIGMMIDPAQAEKIKKTLFGVGKQILKEKAEEVAQQ